MLSRADAFTPRGGLHPKAYEANSNFLEDGRPLLFPELYTWWVTEVERVTALRESLGLPAFAGPELVAIRARTKRYRKHGSDAALCLKASAGRSQPLKRPRGGPEPALSEPEESHGPVGPYPNGDDSFVNSHACGSEEVAGT